MRSMTGFASQTLENERFDLYIEIKSVNSKYFDFKLRGNHQLNALEIELKKRVQQRLQRGKIDFFLKLSEKNADSYTVVTNIALAKKYAEAFRSLSESIGLDSKLEIQDFIRLEGLLTLEQQEMDSEIVQTIFQTLDELLNQLVEMMEIEGQKTAEDIRASLNSISHSLSSIETRYPKALQSYRENLEQRLREILENQIDENRILMETEIVAARTAINEEIVRLYSHLNQFNQILSGKQKGDSRKLDFIAQEMHRETNTIASKSNDSEIIRESISIKSEIEKIREQLRNVV